MSLPFSNNPDSVVERTLIELLRDGISRTITEKEQNGEEFNWTFNFDDPENSQIVLCALPLDENYREIFTKYDKIGIGVAAMITGIRDFVGDWGMNAVVTGVARIIPFSTEAEEVKRWRTAIAFFLRGQRLRFARATSGLALVSVSLDGEVQDIATRFGNRNYKGAFITIGWGGSINTKTNYEKDRVPLDYVKLNIS